MIGHRDTDAWRPLKLIIALRKLHPLNLIADPKCRLLFDSIERQEINFETFNKKEVYDYILNGFWTETLYLQ